MSHQFHQIAQEERVEDAVAVCKISIMNICQLILLTFLCSSLPVPVSNYPFKVVRDHCENCRVFSNIL